MINNKYHLSLTESPLTLCAVLLFLDIADVESYRAWCHSLRVEQLVKVSLKKLQRSFVYILNKDGRQYRVDENRSMKITNQAVNVHTVHTDQVLFKSEQIGNVDL